MQISRLVHKILSEDSRYFAIKGDAYFMDPILEKEDSEVTLKFIISYLKPTSNDLLLGLQIEPKTSENLKTDD